MPQPPPDSTSDAQSSRAQPIRVLCVDDDALIVGSVESMVRAHPSLVWVGSLDKADKLVVVCQHDCPDIVLLDIHMHGADVFETLRLLRRACPSVRAIMLSARLTAGTLAQAIDSGAWGFVYKLDQPSTLIRAIETVAAGSMYFSPTADRMNGPR